MNQVCIIRTHMSRFKNLSVRKTSSETVKLDQIAASEKKDLKKIEKLFKDCF